MASDHGIGGNSALPPGDEPDDAAQVAQFGQQLRAARPALSSAALARVHAAMRRELAIRNVARKPVSRRRWPLMAALAAVVVLGLLVTWYAVTLTPRGPSPELAAAQENARQTEQAKQRAALTSRYLAATTEALKASIAADVAKISTDDQIPTFMQFHAALGLVTPHLQWHAASYSYLDVATEMVQRSEHERWYAERTRMEPHTGETWMREAIPLPVREDLKKNKNKRLAMAEDNLQRPDPSFYWTVDDPKSPDVTRAVAMLATFKDDAAARWADALRCNNTMLTMDVRGGYEAGNAAPVVLDLRAAEDVTFKLYRVTDAAKLDAAAQRIGTDYIFADHAEEKMAKARAEMQLARQIEARKVVPALPEFTSAELAGTWHCAVADLKSIGLRKYEFEDDYWDEEEENDAPDGDYFGDACEQYRARLHREYWPDEGELSAWTCGRKFEIPATALQQAGAYVLVAEANGTRACAPILVDPLSLTLRRCRDGVLVAAGDNHGSAPLAGAQVVAAGMLQPSFTDQNGVAFARVFAAGDKPILIAKDGRFAIGGFGKVFDGIYNGPMEWRNHWGCCLCKRGMRDIPAANPADTVGQVFEDRHVVAAYTDRPTYRPGQDVQFKLIVRLLGQNPDGTASVLGAGFRDGDFETSKLLQLPLPGTTVKFEALDKKGRVIAGGAAGLNEFGTAAGTIHLSDECAAGACALRVYLNGTARIVPDVFAVQNYRRPNFEVALFGVPANLTSLTGQKLSVRVEAKYYFGKLVANAKANVRLVRPESWRPIAESSLTLSSDGVGTAELNLPNPLPGGEYHVICAVTDDSNQTVTQSVSSAADMPPALKTESLADLPRFISASEVLRLRGIASEITADNGANVTRFKPDAAGVAELKLGPGWWTISADGQWSTVFVYGDGAWIHSGQQQDTQNGFVNLANYRSEQSGVTYDYNERKPELWALFGRQHAEVGGTIRVLLYAPNATRALLTMEGRTVLDYLNVPLDGKSEYYVVEIPIRERHVPNFYLQGCVISQTPQELRLKEAQAELQKLKDAELAADDEDPKWCRVDVVDPAAQRGGEKLNVDVICDAPEHRPADDVGVTVRVTGMDGKPRVAEVSLGAVDASLYAFGEDRSAALAQTFSDARPSRRFLPKAWKISTGISFSTARRVQQLAESLKKAQESMRDQQAASKAALSSALDRAVDHAALGLLGEMPATQIPLIGWRTDFRETAAWLPQLRTDDQGRVAARFKLPDSLTRYRINAVGLTQQTEIGTGRSEFVATLPLSVQVFLPRFAVEGDKLLLTGLIHNTTDKAITAPFAFEIQNATCQGPAADTAAQSSSANGTTTVQGKVLVAAHSSAHVGAWLVADRLGSITVGLKAGDAVAADAEQRVIPVIPDGRPLEVALSGAANGDIQLPIGFVPGDVRLSVSRSTPAEALQGLGYLVDYPYGCVEQTMSRFLPSVMAKHAWQQGASELPAEVIKKLPDVLEKGLARLYNFQHADGGWGWWEKDQTNDGMSVYVVYGLARCKSTGTPVDGDVFAKGCAFVKTRLNDATFDRVLWARGWQALALSGTVSADELKLALKDANTLPPEAIASLALACQTLGLSDEAAELRARVKSWAPQTTEGLARKLNLETAFGELVQARLTADALMAQRSGLRWLSTKDTSWAIEAMTALVSHLPPLGPARAFSLSLAGKPLVEATTPEQLTKRVFDVHLTGAQIPSADRTTFTLNADFPEPLHYALNAIGYQHMDKLEPTGTSVTMTRQYLTTDGKPLAKFSTVGDCIAVHVKVTLDSPRVDVMVEDRRPSGWEFAGDILHGQDASRAANTEFRDDRLCVFFDELSAGEHELVYYLRAETPGTSHVIPGCAYPMYDERIRGETGADVLVIGK